MMQYCAKIAVKGSIHILLYVQKYMFQTALVIYYCIGSQAAGLGIVHIFMLEKTAKFICHFGGIFGKKKSNTYFYFY